MSIKICNKLNSAALKSSSTPTMSKKTSVNHSVVKKINSPPPIQIPYDPVLEAGMKVFYSNLSEKDRRYYVGLEAWKIFEGGVTYVSNLLECSRTTIYQGLEEVKKKSDTAEGSDS